MLTSLHLSIISKSIQKRSHTESRLTTLCALTQTVRNMQNATKLNCQCTKTNESLLSQFVKVLTENAHDH